MLLHSMFGNQEQKMVEFEMKTSENTAPIDNFPKSICRGEGTQGQEVQGGGQIRMTPRETAPEWSQKMDEYVEDGGDGWGTTKCYTEDLIAEGGKLVKGEITADHLVIVFNV